MLRDTLNTQEGYKEIIEETLEFIDFDYDDLNSYNDSNSEDRKKIEATYKSLIKYNYELLETYYSLGEEVQGLKEVLVKNIINFKNSWQAEWGYVQMVNMLSLGILFEIENKDFDELIGLVERDNINDYLLDFLIGYRRSDWQLTQKFLWNKPYKGISEIVELARDDKEKALERLKKYLKEWYRGLETKTHESKHNIHTGYWCWEAGAIAKILDLDDSGLKDQPYYPYDMVHWND